MKTILSFTLSFCLFVTVALAVDKPKPSVTSIHAFEEPLVSAQGDEQDAALISALQEFQKRQSYEDVSALTAYLDANPNSLWKFSLLTNLGIVYRKTGHFSKAIDAWEQAWALAKDEKKDLNVKAEADRALSELASLLSSLGRKDRLASLMGEIKSRAIYGSAGAVLTTANENLWVMKNRPDEAYKCGPYALDSIRTQADKKNGHDAMIKQAHSGPEGFSLSQVRDLSNNLKMKYQMAKRQAGSQFITPSVVHWKSGHYAALLKKEGDHYLIKDPTFAQEIQVTAQALEDESSGYFLVPIGSLPEGWVSVPDSEGDKIFGKGVAQTRDLNMTKLTDLCSNCPQSSHAMARYNVLLMLASLTIRDNPVGYNPPIGPGLQFTIVYNQLEATQPSVFTFFNFGPCWNCGWLSYVTVPSFTSGTTYINVRGGGRETYPHTTYVSTGTTYSGYVGYYDFELQSQARVWVTTSGTYERRLPDGSKEVFAQPDSPTSPVRMFLSSIIDPQGNSVTLNYDTTSSYYTSTGNLRLTSLTDALGLSTTLTYGLSGDPLKVTQITDPYARSATFNYTSTAPYQLTSIVDVIGITSSFTYGTGSAISQMDTPYGTTTFTASTSTVVSGTPQIRTLNVVEPDSGQVQVESDLYLYGTGTPNPYPYSPADSAAPAGSGISVYNNELQFGNTYVWDKKAMHDAPGDYTKSHIYHWVLESGYVSSPLVQCEKPALENRIWYDYPGQVSPIYTGSSGKPSVICRLTTGTITQAWKYEYTNTVNIAAVTAAVDPVGRRTNYSYDSNGIDLTGVSQISSMGTDTLTTITYNNTTNPPHCAETVTDAAGQTTSYTYNSQGQVLTITPPTRSGHSAETTTYGYISNYLTSITGPMSGATKTFTYDTLNSHTVNRIKTVADAESYTLTYAYDNLDRKTQITYPDSTTETFSYVNPTTSNVDLDLHSSTDRLGRTTTRTYDAVEHLTSVTDPLSRTMNYSWCSCGSMESLTDPRGNTTYFNRDVESRLTSKVYAGGTQPPTSPDYTYDLIGQVATYTDKRGDVATYSYNLDNSVSGISYSVASGTAATPNVSYSYDSYYPRVTAVGGVSTAYNAPGSLGAGKAHTVTNTMTGGSAVVTYTYDEWGRVVGRDIDGANSETTTLDSLGRVSSLVNVTGTFSYSYFDSSHPTNRVGSISYPNGQSVTYDYFGNTGDERLKQIKNLTPGSAVLSQFDYTYDAMDKIATWQQQTDNNTPLVWNMGYDAADQLTSGTLTSTAISSPAVRVDSYSYDAAGNPTLNVSGVSRSTTYNALNQLTASTPSGNRTMGFTGTLTTGTATVTVNGSSATVNSSHNFSGTASLTTGTTATVPVVATDPSGNSRTNNYQIIVPDEATYSPTYDSDGNELTSGAGQTYTWDGKNQLASITYTGGAKTEFIYDAVGQRIKIIEKNSGGTVTGTKQLVWDGIKPKEERNASNSVTKRFFALSEQIGGTSYFSSLDHLGSIREMTDSSGAIQARYNYDLYGRTTLLSGTNLSDFQYAGNYEHVTSGLNLTMFRAYESDTAKWLSRDPLLNAERSQGPNLYEYIQNDPVKLIDPLGLCPCLPHNNYETSVDAASRVGGGMMAVGGIAAVAGSAMSASVVLAPIGVPVAAAGAAVLAAGGILTALSFPLALLDSQIDCEPDPGNPVQEYIDHPYMMPLRLP